MKIKRRNFKNVIFEQSIDGERELVTILLEGVWVYKKSKARRRTGVGSGRVDPGKAVFFFSSLV